MIDRHYGHLARDGREHAITLLDATTPRSGLNVHVVDAGWTRKKYSAAEHSNRNSL